MYPVFFSVPGTDAQSELSCLRNKSWDGVASLEIGDLPTLIFSDRRFYGEMFHVLIKMKRDIIPLHQVPIAQDVRK